jgi:predicted PurR-regulated permease PerM
VFFQRLLDFLAGLLAARGAPRKLAVGLVALVLLAGASTAGYFAAMWTVHAAQRARHTVPARIEELRHMPLWLQIEEHLPDADEVLENLKHYSASIFSALSAVGHGAIFALIGFILAVVFVLEEEELTAWAKTLPARGLRGTLVRWLSYLADALLVTVQFQCVVAACNALLTFPVLLFVRIPHAPALALLIFASGLVPVVGNFVMGIVLSFLAYQAQGWLGVGIFTALTFILHKLESYYLNPRLAARHVHLPSFVLVVSLVLWEHALGLVGLFISFPFLYVAQRIRAELVSEDAAAQ